MWCKRDRIQGFKMKKYHYWLAAVLLLSSLPLLGLAGYNYYLDPLWVFTHENKYNSMQHGFDERQQKTNYLTFHEPAYDSVLLGSSRATYIDQNDFAPWRTFNYAVNNMLPEEYQDYLDYFTLTQGKAPAVIFLAVDFFATNRNAQRADNFFPPRHYIEQACSPFYRGKLLLSLQVYERAQANYLNAAVPQPQVNYTYDRHNVKYLTQHADPDQAEAAIANTVESYKTTLYADYEYGSLRQYWRALKAAYPQSEFVVFTTPVAAPLLEMLKEQGLYPFYESWLRELTGEFGNVHHFMFINAFTREVNNFFDGSHVYPQAACLLIDFIMGRTTPAEYGTLGMLLTPSDLEEQLSLLRQLNGLQPRPAVDS